MTDTRRGGPVVYPDRWEIAAESAVRERLLANQALLGSLDVELIDLEIGAHVAAADPHGDRAFALAQVLAGSDAVAIGLAIDAHVIAADPHSDRAWASSLVAALNKASVGLELVDNTADANKPVSTATATALGAKALGTDVTALAGRTTTLEAHIDATFGDGSDGVINFDGTTTLLGLVPAAGVYTMNRDLYLANGSQISATAELRTANFRVFCRGTLTIGATAKLTADGPSSVGSAAGIALGAGTLVGGVSGSTGPNFANAGSPGTSIGNWPLGSAGGAGGAASGGGSGGGAIGGSVTVSAQNGLPRNIGDALRATSGGVSWRGGASGGTGASTTSSAAGGSGASGQVLVVVAYNLVINGILRAAGGSGGAASGAGTGAGGGGGAGGGAIVAIYHTKSGSASALTSAANAPGGLGGTAQGAGATGLPGVAGAVFELVS